MIKFIAIIVACVLLLTTGCSTAANSNQSAAADVLANYLQAFADKNEPRISSLVCQNWSEEAFLEYDAFQGVKTQLEGLSCEVSGSENDAVLVSCQGKILASYQNEAQEFNLCQRVYRLQKSGADWQVCGYTQPIEKTSDC